MPASKIFLLADDDADDRMLFCMALETAAPGSVCLTVKDGKELLDTLTKLNDNASVIFLDVNMPVMNGWECLTELKKNTTYSNIPVIIYSTSSHQHEVDRAHELGALCFFVKPDDFYDLIEILKLISDNLDKDLYSAICKNKDIKHLKQKKQD